MVTSSTLLVPGRYPDQAEHNAGPLHPFKPDPWTEYQSNLGDNEQIQNSTTSPTSRPGSSSYDTFISNRVRQPAHNLNTQEGIDATVEEQDLARAIEMSLKARRLDRSSTVAGSDGPGPAVANDGSAEDSARNSTSEATSLKKKKPPKNTLQDMVDNLALRLSNEFTPLSDDSGDTLVYIGPPAKTRDQTYDEYAHIKKHFDHFHFISSRRLRDLGSENIDKLLRPNACIRAEKRLKKLDAYRNVSQSVRQATQYHVDLRPPNEDEEAVILLTDLSCSHGIRTWHLAQKKYGLSPIAVAGTDQLDTPSNPYYMDHQLLLKSSADDDDEPEKPPAPPNANLVPEYSALRHHSSVERLLQAVHGNDPKLDSAPKMWAFFAIARYFGCAQHHLVNKWLLAWLSKPGNKNFIQANPETAYRVGMGIMDPALTLDAFSILVGEKALVDVCSEISCTVPSASTSIHGRQRENLDDEEVNRVSHAASSLVRRMTETFRTVVVDLEWIYSSKEHQKLLDVKGQDPVEDQMIENAKYLLRAFVKGRFLYMLQMGLAYAFSDLDLQASDTTAFRHGDIERFDIAYTSLVREVRPFTRTFWMALSRAKFQEGRFNTSITHIDEMKNLSRDDASVESIKIVSRGSIDKAFMEINKMLMKREAEAARNMSFDTRKKWIPSNAYGVANPLTFAQQPATEPTIEPVVNIPKRASNGLEAFPTSPGKRRKTLENDTETMTLPYRLAGSVNPASPAHTQPAEVLYEDDHGLLPRSGGHGPEESVLKEESFDGDMFAMEDVTNQQHEVTNQIYGALASLNGPQHVPLPPLESQKPNSSLTNDSSSSTCVPAQKFAYVREFDPESNLDVFKLKPVYDVPPFVPRQRSINEALGSSNTQHSHTNQDWRFDQETRNWVMPGREPGHPCFPEPGSHLPWQWQDPVSTSPKTDRKPVQQFSNSNTPRFGVTSSPEDSKKSTDNYTNFYTFPMNPNTILCEFSEKLEKRCQDIIWPSHLFHGDDRVPVDLIDHLMNIGEDEIKFLPMWAGGLDDGSGGVFDDMHVPNLETGGFRGGKRGMNTNGLHGEGSVNGSESSFDDIASDAVSTVGKASKAATDGTQTVKSLSENCDTDSESEFMNQDDVYEAIQELRMEQIKKGKMRASDESDDDGDDSTVMGATSDVQGDMFGDVDDDDGVGSPFAQDEDDDEKINAKPKAAAFDSDDDMDMEIIDKDNL